MFSDFKTHMFSCYLFSMVYVSFFCIEFVRFTLCFLGLDSYIATRESYFDLDLLGIIQNIFIFCCMYVDSNEPL